MSFFLLNPVSTEYTPLLWAPTWRIIPIRIRVFFHPGDWFRPLKHRVVGPFQMAFHFMAPINGGY